jgi:hypothetical protein
MCVNSISSRRGRKLYRMVGILHSSTSSPLMSCTSLLLICGARTPRRSCLPSGAGAYRSAFSSHESSVASSLSVTCDGAYESR